MEEINVEKYHAQFENERLPRWLIGLFLAGAFYCLMIIAAPTAFAADVGNTTAESNPNNLNHNPGSGPNVVCETFTAPMDMTDADSISGFMDGGGGTFGVWEMVGGLPTTLVPNSTEVFSAAASNWYTVSYSTKPSFTPGNDYCVGYVSASLGTHYYYSGVTPANSYFGFTATDATPSDLTGGFVGNPGSDGAGDTSFYLTYTPGGGGGGGGGTGTTSSSTILLLKDTMTQDEFLFLIMVFLFIASVPFWERTLTIKREGLRSV